MCVVVPELTNKMINDAKTLIGVFDISLNVRIALLFNFEENKQREILQRLKFDNKTIKNVCGIRKWVYTICLYNKNELIPKIVTKYILNYDDGLINDVISALKGIQKIF